MFFLAAASKTPSRSHCNRVEWPLPPQLVFSLPAWPLHLISRRLPPRPTAARRTAGRMSLSGVYVSGFSRRLFQFLAAFRLAPIKIIARMVIIISILALGAVSRAATAENCEAQGDAGPRRARSTRRRDHEGGRRNQSEGGRGGVVFEVVSERRRIGWAFNVC